MTTIDTDTKNTIRARLAYVGCTVTRITATTITVDFGNVAQPDFFKPETVIAGILSRDFGVELAVKVRNIRFRPAAPANLDPSSFDA